MFATHKSFSDAGINPAGSGDSLASARAASFRTQDDVTIALVAAAECPLPASVAGAGDDSKNTRPCPGLSVLRAPLTTLVTQDVFDAMKEVARAQGQTIGDTDTSFELYGCQFPYATSRWRVADEPGLLWDINQSDREGILNSIEEALKTTPNVFFSFHAHESLTGNYDSQQPLPFDATVPASYIQNITRSAIEAGAAAVFVHGPHHVRGIELYQGEAYLLQSWKLDVQSGAYHPGHTAYHRVG